MGTGAMRRQLSYSFLRLVLLFVAAMRIHSDHLALLNGKAIDMRWKPEQEKGRSLRESANPTIGKMKNIDNQHFAASSPLRLATERHAAK